MEQNAALERELRDARQSLSDAGPTMAPSTSVAFVEGPVVVVPTPMGPVARPSSSCLVVCTISLRGSESDIGGRQVYPQLRSEVHVVQHDGTGSNEVLFPILHFLWFFSYLLISSHILVCFHHL